MGNPKKTQTSHPIRKTNLCFNLRNILICFVFLWTPWSFTQESPVALQTLSLYPTLSWSLLQDAEEPNLFATYETEFKILSPASSLHLSEDQFEQNLSSKIQTLNQQDLLHFLQQKEKLLQKFHPITKKQAQNILDLLNTHPIVGGKMAQHYDQQNGQVGFCFGRAHYTHLELLRHHVHSEQTSKIFAIGGLLYGDITWDYHVATAVQGPENQWWVIDGLQTEVMDVQDWMKKISTWDANRRFPMLRYYLTPGWKFQPIQAAHPNYPIYSELYGPYFRDLSIWFHSHPMQLLPQMFEQPP